MGAFAIAHAQSLGLFSAPLPLLSYIAYGLFAPIVLLAMRAAKSNLLMAALGAAGFMFLLSDSWVAERLNEQTIAMLYFCANALIAFNFIVATMIPSARVFTIGGLMLILFATAEFLIAVIFSASPIWQNLGLGDKEAYLAALIVFGFAQAVLLISAISRPRDSEPPASMMALVAFFIGLHLYPDQKSFFIFFSAGAFILTIGMLFDAVSSRRKHTVVPKSARSKKNEKVKQTKAAQSEPAAVAIPIVKPKRNFADQLKSIVERIKSIAQMFAKKSCEAIVVHIDTDCKGIEERVNVVLSPAYYWYKHSDVAFKNLRAAKRFAQSIFFSWIPEGNYRYFVFKETSGYGFIACDTAQTRARLIAQGMDVYLIDRLFFAQRALDKTYSPIRVSEDTLLASLQDVWVSVPLSFAKDAQRLDRLTIDRRQSSFRLPRAKMPSDESADINRKTFAYAACLMLFFAAGLVIDLWRVTHRTNDLERAAQEALEAAKLPQTLLQLESIEKRLTATAKSQYALREQLAKVLASAQNGRIESLKLESNSITALYRPTFSSNLAAFSEQLQSSFVGAQATISGELVQVVIKW
ncbi:MAG: hypothetical protein LBN32_03595 [Helicobacteraceae bacterium]|nr:hypothetical protein [Helicobacteraceae bacterium]